MTQFGDKDFSKETYLKQIAFIDSILADSTLTDVVRARVINTKIHSYCVGVIESRMRGTGQLKYTTYNYALS